MDYLSKQVIKYQEKRQKFENIFSILAEEIYNYPRNEEHRGGFLIFFYPRLKKLCKTFEYQGIPFSHYLRKTIKWQYKSFLKEISTRNNLEDILSSSDFQELYLNRSALSFNSAHDKKTSMLAEILKNAKGKERTRLFFLILREIEYLPPDYEEEIAEIMEIETDHLQYIFSELRKRRHSRIIKRQIVQKKRNALNMRILLLEKQIELASEEEKIQLIEEIEKKKIRLKKLDRKLEKMSIRAKHSDIAEVLNIPKGTIDSGIYYIIKRSQEGTSFINNYFSDFNSASKACHGNVAHFTLTG
ncbi:hypothetical protein WKV44_09435 [Spirochaetia bacterium 38H-sp]|uniref:Sigma-70 family RNA polymerase sigma factor n=1 Tax=Rarispira pelagica TaxID=3141764 RepID=A0ABU9UDJ9_9SPIR